jgi:sugar lactone lactonase YvrE
MRPLALLFLTACTTTPDETDPVDDTDACPQTETVPTALATGLTGGTEGIAFGPDGTLYVAADDQVVTIDTDGVVTPFADVPAPVGLVWWRDALWAASWEDEAGDDSPALVEITATGEAVRHALPEVAKPNFLTPTPWGTLLISDDFDTRIFERTAAGVVTVWASEVPSPNGMAFSADGATLYVANTFVSPAPIQAFPVSDGLAGAPTTLVEYGPGTTPDGLAIARTGELLIALNLANRIDVWDGAQATPLAIDLPTVASLAFGQPPFNPCAVYATSLFGDAVWTVPVGLRGDRP